MNTSLLVCKELLKIQVGLDDLKNDVSSNETLRQLDILKAQATCHIEAFTSQFLPFIEFVRFLLHYGTSVIVAIGVVLNAVSFVVLLQKNMRRSASSLFLSVLAIYDSLALLLNFMIGVIRGQNPGANQNFMDSQFLCKFHGVLVEVFNLLSVWTIVAFTIERFIIVKFPLKAKLFTTVKTLLIIGCVSMAVLIFSCHKIFVTGFEGDSVFGYKGCQTDRARIPGIVYFYVAFNTWLPTIIIMTFNIAIIRAIKIHQAKRETMTTTTSRTDAKATRLLLTVSFAYLLLVFPLGVIQTIELFWNAKVNSSVVTDPDYVDNRIVKIKLKWVRAFFFFFYQINFAVNFFLYVFSSSGARFRYNLRRLFGLKAQPLLNETMVEPSRNAVVPAENTSLPASQTET
ncbi:neuromedin-U receptor 2-like [Liolophura sinensis]|uniref:neuromedin-U receptor 2-like n=1 Tax=Liolophura sinensis TaxID=3198878 RepID=UPI003158E206